MNAITAVEVTEGMTIRPAAGDPLDLYRGRLPFQKVTTATEGGGWVKITFTDGSSAETRRTSQWERATLITCAECGSGHYFHTGNGVYACTKGCGHEITWADILPEADEEIVLVNGRIAVATI